MRKRASAVCNTRQSYSISTWIDNGLEDNDNICTGAKTAAAAEEKEEVADRDIVLADSLSAQSPSSVDANRYVPVA